MLPLFLVQSYILLALIFSPNSSSMPLKVLNLQTYYEISREKFYLQKFIKFAKPILSIFSFWREADRKAVKVGPGTQYPRQRTPSKYKSETLGRPLKVLK